MITREIDDLANELTNMVINAIYHIVKVRQEDSIDLSFQFHNETYKELNVSFPYDDEEFDNEDDYLDEMVIVVNVEWIEDDGEMYEIEKCLTDLDLGALLEIYNTIKK